MFAFCSWHFFFHKFVFFFFFLFWWSTVIICVSCCGWSQILPPFIINYIHLISGTRIMSGKWWIHVVSWWLFLHMQKPVGWSVKWGRHAQCVICITYYGILSMERRSCLVAASVYSTWWFQAQYWIPARSLNHLQSLNFFQRNPFHRNPSCHVYPNVACDREVMWHVGVGLPIWVVSEWILCL